MEILKALIAGAFLGLVVSASVTVIIIGVRQDNCTYMVPVKNHPGITTCNSKPVAKEVK